MTKKVDQQKTFLSVIAKSSNWEILMFFGFTEKSNF